MSTYLLALAVLPGLLISWAVYRADKYEHEPIWAVAACFGLGALATIPALQFELWSIPRVGEIEKDPVLTFLLAFGAIAPAEELAKWLMLVFGAFVWRFFNEPFDGIVYSVMVAMGFATVENVMYINEFGDDTALLRAFTAVPSHLVFAVAQGYYVGLAKHRPSSQMQLLFHALIVSILLHGVYDFLVLQHWTKWLGTLGALSVYLCIYYFGALFRAHLERSPFKNGL